MRSLKNLKAQMEGEQDEKWILSNYRNFKRNWRSISSENIRERKYGSWGWLAML